MCTHESKGRECAHGFAGVGGRRRGRSRERWEAEAALVVVREEGGARGNGGGERLMNPRKFQGSRGLPNLQANARLD